MKKLAGQGATEYLVLLAVVLIIALVGIALLGFFPGTANDAQIAESQIYWRSASPLAIADSPGAYYVQASNYDAAYLRVRNTGQYPVRISKILGNGAYINQTYDNVGTFGGGPRDLVTNTYFSPGEEICFGNAALSGTNCAERRFNILLGASSSGTWSLIAASSLCYNQTTGSLVIPNFGFEYIQYVEGQQITKNFIGSKPLVIKCMGPA